MLLTIVLLFSFLLQEGVVKFTSDTQLVVQLVTVKGKDGHIVEGLTAKDFTVTENGIPQVIKYCEFQKLLDTGDTTAPVTTVDATVRTQITPEPVGSIRYKDRRLIGMYFDMSAMPPADQIRALGAAQRFIRTQLAAPDLVAIMTFNSGAVKVIEDFTNNRERLLTSIQTLIVGDAQGNDENPNDASAADTGAAFGQDDAEFNIFNTDRQLAALQTAVKMLGSLNEKKSLVYFASGLRLNGVDNQAQLQATTNAAIRANVALYPVDARGLVANAPLGTQRKGHRVAPACTPVHRRWR